jgi:hypothetical protein
MAPVLGEAFGWDAARVKDELDGYENRVRDELLRLDRALAHR